ncbi:MAG: ribonuclease Z [Candidatus Micrarchaeota archaeon]
MIDITFLGTSGSIPTPERNLPAIFLKVNGINILFDCGEGTQRQMMNYKVGFGSIDAVFITHAHLDHYLGLFGLIETLRLSQPSPKQVSLFVPEELFEIFTSKNYSFLNIQKIKSGKLLKIKDFTISAFTVKHSKNSFGFILQEDDKIKFYEEKAHALGLQGELFTKIQKRGFVKIKDKKVTLKEVSFVKPGKKLVYTGDCAPSLTIIKAAKNADLLIHEATFDTAFTKEAKERMHSTAKQAAEVAKKANVNQLILTHISPRYSKDEFVSTLLNEAQILFTSTRLAKDGLTIRL